VQAVRTLSTKSVRVCLPCKSHSTIIFATLFPLYHRMKKSLLFILSTLILIMSSCERTDSVITIKTEFGDMVAILYDETPKHKENFIKLVKEHYYDSLLF